MTQKHFLFPVWLGWALLFLGAVRIMGADLTSPHTLAWRQTYDGPAGFHDQGKSGGVDSQGNVFVTGRSHNNEDPPFNSDIYTAKYASGTGSTIWEVRKDGPAHGDDVPTTLRVDANGDAVVAATVQDPTSGDRRAYLAKYAGASGTVLWEKTMPSWARDGAPDHQEVLDMVVDFEGNVVYTGFCYNVDTGGLPKLVTAKLNGANGNEIWHNIYSYAAVDGLNYGQSVAVDGQNNVYVTGNVSTDGMLSDLCLLKLSPINGNRLWVKTYGTTQTDDLGRKVIVAKNGDVIVTGYTTSNGEMDYYTGRYLSADGNLVWQKIYQGSGGEDQATSVAADANGNIFVTGYSEATGDQDIVTIKYSASAGDLLWEKRYDGSDHGNDGGWDIAVDASGNVVITGYSSSGLGVDQKSDSMTLAYAAATGTKLWEHRNAGVGATQTVQLALDTSANVYAFGFTWNGISQDMLTLKLGSAPISTTPSVSVTVAPSCVTEDSGQSFVYTFRRTGPTSAALTAKFETSGTATRATDYAVTTSASVTYSNSTGQGTVKFPIGAATMTVNVTVISGDAVGENDESVSMNVLAGTGYSVGSPSSATGTIVDGSGTAPVTVEALESTVTEDGFQILRFRFVRSGSLSLADTYNFGVSGSASFGTDYTHAFTVGSGTMSGVAGSVTFPAGEPEVYLNLDPSADNAIEDDETITITLAVESGCGSTQASTATGTIINDDGITTYVTVSASPGSVLEDGNQPLVFTFTRTFPYGDMIAAFRFSGTAKRGIDYIASAPDGFSYSSTEGYVWFRGTKSTTNLIVTPVTDPDIEPDETVIVTLLPISNYVVGTPDKATGSILNDDFGPEISIEHTAGEILSGAQVEIGTALCSETIFKTFVVRNVGSGNLNLGLLKLQGGNVWDFRLDATGMSSVLAPGETTQFRVEYLARQPGEQQVTLLLPNNDSNENPYTLTLTGRKGDSGSLDTSFGGSGIGYNRDTPAGSIGGAAFQRDGKLVVGGSYTYQGLTAGRFFSDGTLDLGFGTDGTALAPISTSLNVGIATALQPDGRIVVAGYANLGTDDFSIARFQRNGDPDTTFGSSGKRTFDMMGGEDRAYDVAIQADGRIVVVGQVSSSTSGLDFGLVRLWSDGSLDTTFGSSGKVVTDFGINDVDSAGCMVLQQDGKILVGGYAYSSTAGQGYNFALARYLPNGALDVTFGSGGRVTTHMLGTSERLFDLVLQEDGKIVATGYTYSGSYQVAVLRYLPNGTLDSSFGTGGKVATDLGPALDWGSSVAVQVDGKIVVSGATDKNSSPYAALLRYQANGTLDTSFNDTGIIADLPSNGTASATVLLQEDGRIVTVDTSLAARYESGLKLSPAVFGANGSSQLGDRSLVNRNSPVQVSQRGVLRGKTIASLAPGRDHTVALCTDGTLVAWGGNGSGQLGDNSTQDKAEPVLVNVEPGLSALSGKRVIAVSAGETHSLALCSDGTIAAWGSNGEGRLGDGTTTQRSVPVKVSDAGASILSGRIPVEIVAGQYCSYALCSDGTVAAWGYNSFGQLGDNSTTHRYLPVRVNQTNGQSALYGKRVIRLAAGSHCLALCSDGTLAAWGYNDYGQLGDGTTTSRSVPVAVNAVTGTSALAGKTIVAIAAGGFHSLALASDGTLVACGGNGDGQLGDNTRTQRNVPVLVNVAAGVSGLAGKTAVTLGGGLFHSLARCSDGSLMAWGKNTEGQLGDGSNIQRLVPTAVNIASLGSNLRVVEVASGFSYHTAAIVAAPILCPSATPDLAIADGTEISSLTDMTSGATVDFGASLIDQEVSRTFTLTNCGTADLTALAATLTGPDVAQFSSSGLTVTALTAPTGTTQMTVTFRPAAPGEMSAVLELTSNDPDENPFRLHLSGRGVERSPISFSQSSFKTTNEASQVQLTLTRPTAYLQATAWVVTEDGATGKVPPFSPARAGVDYTSPGANGAEVAFGVGEFSRTLTLGIVPRSGVTVPNKRFSAKIKTLSAAALPGAIASTKIEILADDGKKPTLSLSEPVALHTGLIPCRVKGVVGDARGVDRVLVQLNGGPPIEAELSTAASSPTAVPFTAYVLPRLGTNTLTITAYDLRGNFSVLTRSFTFAQPFPFTLNLQMPATLKVGSVTQTAKPASSMSAVVNSNDGLNRTAQILNGTELQLTAAVKPGYVFSHWLNLPSGALTVGNIAFFHMPPAPVNLTAVFVETPFVLPASPGNTFLGLLHADEETSMASNATEGLISVSVTATGSFTGRLMIDGASKALAGTFFANGSGVFISGATKSTAFVFGTNILFISYSEDGIDLTLYGQTSVSKGKAKRVAYHGGNKVVGSLLNSPAKGVYTSFFPPQEQTSGIAATSYPQGHGFAMLTLTNTGVVTVSGALADGASITAGSALLPANEMPLYVLLPTPGSATLKGSSLSGMVMFVPGQLEGDLTATDLWWFRAPSVGTAPALYPSAWPGGIRLSSIGSLYSSSISVQSSLGLDQEGAGRLFFSEGNLVSTIDERDFKVIGNTVSKTAVDTSFTLAITSSSGAFNGTFTPNWANALTTKPAFRGILIQSGLSKGGYGYFHSNAKNDPAPKSGAVILGRSE